jgi:anti-sigma B factor antagonist
MERLSVGVEPAGSGRFVLRLAGDLDLAGADGFWGVLEPLLVPGGRVVLDCAGLGFLDSSGLRILLLGARRAAATDASVRLAAPRHAVRRTLELAGANELIGSYATVDEALSGSAASDAPAASGTTHGTGGAA